MLDAAGVGAFRGSEIILVFFSAVAIVPVRRTHRSEHGRHHVLGDNKDVGTITCVPAQQHRAWSARVGAWHVGGRWHVAGAGTYQAPGSGHSTGIPGGSLHRFDGRPPTCCEPQEDVVAEDSGRRLRVHDGAVDEAWP